MNTELQPPVSRPDRTPGRRGMKTGATSAAVLCVVFVMLPATIRMFRSNGDPNWFPLLFVFSIPMAGIAAIIGAFAGQFAAKTDKTPVGMLIGATVFALFSLMPILLVYFLSDPHEAPWTICLPFAVSGALCGGTSTISARSQNIARSTGRWKLPRITLAELMSLTAGFALFFALGRILFVDTRPTLTQVQQQIHRELPIGTNHEAVDLWLQRNHVSASSQPLDSVKYVCNDLVREQGIAPNRVSECVRGIVQNANTETMWSGDIDVYFFFDRDGNLLGYVFKRWLWSL